MYLQKLQFDMETKACTRMHRASDASTNNLSLFPKPVLERTDSNSPQIAVALVHISQKDLVGEGLGNSLFRSKPKPNQNPKPNLKKKEKKRKGKKLGKKFDLS